MNQIFTYLGGGVTAITIAFGLIKYFSKNVFENYLLRELETHKNGLERLNISYQIKFSALHAERAEVIKSLYYYLYEYKLVLNTFFTIELNNSQAEIHLKNLLGNWDNIIIGFSETFHKHKIFFSISQVALINVIHNKMSTINKGTQIFLRTYDNNIDKINAIQSKTPEFSKLKLESNLLIDEIMILESQLENEFRNLLGVEFKK